MMAQYKKFRNRCGSFSLTPNNLVQYLRDRLPYIRFVNKEQVCRGLQGRYIRGTKWGRREEKENLPRK
jgi:hypothetical protein